MNSEFEEFLKKEKEKGTKKLITWLILIALIPTTIIVGTFYLFF